MLTRVHILACHTVAPALLLSANRHPFVDVCGCTVAIVMVVLVLTGGCEVLRSL